VTAAVFERREDLCGILLNGGRDGAQHLHDREGNGTT
jgi:hypothetical protein